MSKDIKHTVIIAEAGVNHNGDLNIARKLIDAAAEAGVDYVKFQTFKAKKLVSDATKLASYQKENIGENTSQLEMLQKLELKDSDHEVLVAYCQEKGIRFLSTPFDEDSAVFLQQLGIRIGKIPSGEVTNLPYLRKMAAVFPSIIMSTGMADIDEVGAALQVLIDAGVQKENITVLHCNTEYPTPMTDVNLLAMQSIREQFDVKVGYSDHTLGIEVPIAAVALGAGIIEKHFTLDRNMKGPDHRASLEPQELKQMVAAIRNIELAVSGSGSKTPSDSEKKNIAIARKSIHINRALKKGEVISPGDLVMLRPGDGISPFDMEKVTGKKVNNDLAAFHKLSWSDLS